MLFCVGPFCTEREKRAQEIISLLSLKNSIALCFCVLAARSQTLMMELCRCVCVYACVCKTVGREHENGKNNTKN